MSLDKAMKNLKFDSRLTEYNLNNGILTKEEYATYLKSLADLAPQTEAIEIDDRRNTEDQH